MRSRVTVARLPPVSGRIAVVTPRFGAGVVGGSEALSREIAVGLGRRGWAVDVLTTCAVDHFSWANELPEGVTFEEGVTVRRFANVHHLSPAGRRAQLAIQAEVLPSIDEQVSWLSSRFSVPGLFAHLLREGGRYQAILFSPYLFWTSTVCLPVVAERAISMPCLHDEFYARLDVVRPVLTDPARLWFLSEPEHDLAHRLAPIPDNHTVTGAGVVAPDSYDPEGFRRRHGLTRPFLLYAARREREKGWNWLLDAFATTVAGSDIPVDLVSIGAGDVDIPAALRRRVLDLGTVSDAERDNAMAAAVAYAQPSRMESFSRSIMEAWLAGTPVLAIEGSEVVGWHLRRSGGGRIFSDAAGLADALRQLVADPGMATDLAGRGRRYVIDNYSWPVVLDRMEADLAAMTGPTAPAAPAASASGAGEP